MRVLSAARVGLGGRCGGLSRVREKGPLATEGPGLMLGRSGTKVLDNLGGFRLAGGGGAEEAAAEGSFNPRFQILGIFFECTGLQPTSGRSGGAGGWSSCGKVISSRQTPGRDWRGRRVGGLVHPERGGGRLRRGRWRGEQNRWPLPGNGVSVQKINRWCKKGNQSLP
jgi:hypothetical protein